MQTTHDGSELAQVAIAAERNAADFYRRAGKVCPQIAGLLERLAEREEEHLDRIRTRLEDLGTAETADAEGKRSGYLAAIVGLHAGEGNRKAQELSPDASRDDILLRAIEGEKGAILFYAGLKDRITDAQGAQFLEDLIQEEMGHVAELYREWKSGGRT
jgi:rubrerythrin